MRCVAALRRRCAWAAAARCAWCARRPACVARRGGRRPVTHSVRRRNQAQAAAQPRCRIVHLCFAFCSFRAPFLARVSSIQLSCALVRWIARNCGSRSAKCRFKGSEGKERRAQSERPGAIATRSVLGAASAAVALASSSRRRPRPQEQSRAWTPSAPVRVSGLHWSGASHNVTTRLILSLIHI